MRFSGPKCRSSLWRAARALCLVMAWSVGSAMGLDGAMAVGREANTPADEQACFQFADRELEIELVAAEPDVVSPVAMAWDAQGRLYVAEMIGYPASENQCRIALLEDRDGDGRYRRAATFADGMSFVASVMPYRDGLLATVAPDLLFLQDTDGDGRADVRRVEWTGFGTGSQQLRANALHWGLDNWIYGANGRCDGEIRRPDAPPESAVSIRTRDFRFRPAGATFQSIIGQSQFGQSHDDWGNRFLSWNTIPLRHVVMEDRSLAASPRRAAEAVFDVADPADTGRVYPISPPPRQFNSEQANYYNAMCGLNMYRGDRLGADYAGNAFVCESLTNLVTRRVLEPSGPTFVSRRAERERDREFLASSDNWFHPVNLPTGPDGSLYVVDFYREFVEHPIYVANLEARAATDWRRGAQHGRIWRIKRRGTSPAVDRAPAALAQLSTENLVQTLEHPVGWWRDTAQRLLVEHQDRAAVRPLGRLVRRSPWPLARVHALWTLDGLASLDDATLLAALGDTHPGVRRQAVRLAESRQQDSEALRAAVLRLIRDPDPGVRFQLALAIGSTGAAGAVDALAELLGTADDRWLTLAVMASATRDPWALLDRLAARELWIARPTVAQARLLEELGEQLGARHEMRSVESCAQWLSAVGDESSSAGRIAVLAGLARTLDRKSLTSLERTGKLAAADPPDVTTPGVFSPLVRWAANVAGADEAEAESRVRAIDVLARCDEQAAPMLLTLLRASGPAPVSMAAARGLAQLNDAASAAEVYASWSRLPVSSRQAVLAAATRSNASTESLLAALEANTLLVGELPVTVRAGLAELRDGVLKGRAAKLLAESPLGNRQEVVTRYLAAARIQGDRTRGAALFKEHCLACHSVQGHGGRVGPDLAGVGSRRNDLLVIDILDPSRNVTPDFVSYAVATSQGQVLSGLIVAESADSITLRRAGGEQDTIARGAIEELRSTGKSLMPDGLEEKLAPEQLADVLEFLRQPDRGLLEH
jgi:putative membrane-bound dehydrogenase-like protein